jgi:hypothetical protein
MPLTHFVGSVLGQTWVNLKDVLTRLPTQPASRIDELLPHRWLPNSSA